MARSILAKLLSTRTKSFLELQAKLRAKEEVLERVAKELQVEEKDVINTIKQLKNDK